MKPWAQNILTAAGAVVVGTASVQANEDRFEAPEANALSERDALQAVVAAGDTLANMKHSGASDMNIATAQARFDTAQAAYEALRAGEEITYPGDEAFEALAENGSEGSGFDKDGNIIMRAESAEKYEGLSAEGTTQGEADLAREKAEAARAEELARHNRAIADANSNTLRARTNENYAWERYNQSTTAPTVGKINADANELRARERYVRSQNDLQREQFRNSPEGRALWEAQRYAPRELRGILGIIQGVGEANGGFQGQGGGYQQHHQYNPQRGPRPFQNYNGNDAVRALEGIGRIFNGGGFNFR